MAKSKKITARPAPYKTTKPGQHTSMAGEPEQAFATSAGSGRLVKLRGNTVIFPGTTNKPEWLMTPVEKMGIVRKGISKTNLESLKNKANLDYDKLSKILSTTRATLINKKGAQHFSQALSERIVGIADIYSYGFEVFDDENAFNSWMFRPNRALGGKEPYELMDNQFGRQEIKNVIGRIDYGVYS